MNADGVAQECTVCGSTEACICASSVAYARRLALRGFRAAQDHEFSAGALLLAESTSTGTDVPGVREATGLCAFATGDVKTARSAWRAAVYADPSSGAAEWLESLTSGDLRRVVDTYNTALQRARAGEFASAREALELVTRMCPTFLPAARLRGLLDSQGSVPPQPSSVPTRVSKLSASKQEGPSTPRMNLPWRTALSAAVVGAVVGALGTVLYARQETASAVAPTTSVSSTTSVAVDTLVALRRSLGVLIAANPESLAVLLETVGVDAVNWSNAALRESDRIRRAAGWILYRSGRAAFQKGDADVAVRQLRRAIELGTGNYFEDDAMYLLMRAQILAGDTAGGSTTARLLLQKHSGSIYANSVTRRIAGQ